MNQTIRTKCYELLRADLGADFLVEELPEPDGSSNFKGKITHVSGKVKFFATVVNVPDPSHLIEGWAKDMGAQLRLVFQ
jgi:hypothetical protein